MGLQCSATIVRSGASSGMSKEWKQWEGHTVDGEFRLLEFLGARQHSAVFLTECARQGIKKAAIKLTPSEPGTAERQLSRWKQAIQLSHPHLIRLFHSGRCRLDSMELLYVVMEYAEDDLSKLLPNRPLTPTETSEILVPVLDALKYIHDEGFVHGHLKPSNLMVVSGQLKLSSDGLRRAGEPRSEIENSSTYDPQGLEEEEDTWSLGTLVVEALTQQPLILKEIQDVPQSVPVPFRDFVMRCLDRDPDRRWTVADFAERLRGVSPPAPVQTTTADLESVPSSRRYIRPALALSLLLLVVLAGARFLSRQSDTPQSPAVTVEQPTTEPKSEEGSEEQVPRTSALVPGEVSDRVLPDVPQSARDTIRGTVRVGVRVRVDETGSVIDAEVDSPGPSQYFARLALQSSRLWRFAPPRVNQQDVPSEWSLRFGFTNSQTTVDAVQVVP
jgi:TonB family protein